MASYPLSCGSEASWSRFAGKGDAGNGLGGLRARLLGNPDYDLAAFAAERDLRMLRDGEFAAAYETKNPNIAPFIARGGKLLLWHGFDDPSAVPARQH
jgi:feruloyl esterase